MVELLARELERASRKDRSILDRGELLAMLESEDWTVRMHVCRMLPRVEWPADEYNEVLAFAWRQALGDSNFVKAWAIDALASFAATDDSLQAEVIPLLKAAMLNGPPSVRVRARVGLKRL